MAADFAALVRPLRASSTAALGARLAVALLFGAYAFYQIGRGAYFAQAWSQDFQWSPARLLAMRQDPYSWSLAGDPAGGILMSQDPNYLHLLYIVLLPLAALPFAIAKTLWAATNIALGIAAGAALAQAAGLRGASLAAALAVYLAAEPFAHTLGNGQQSLVCLFALTLAWRFRDRASGGLALALGAVKYSFAPAFALQFLIERRFAALAAALALGLAGLFAFAVLCERSPLDVLFEPLAVSAKATHVGLADALSLGRSLGWDGAGLDLACLALSAIAAAALARARLDDGAILAGLGLISLFAGFHNLYDYVFLAPLFFRALTFPAGLRAILLGYVGVFWFALPQIDASPALKTPWGIGALLLLSLAAFATLILAGPRRTFG